MTAITPAYRMPRPRLREIEDAVIGVSSWLAPMGALLPAAWITAERMIVYLAIPGPAACVMAGAVELMGLAIVATRTALIDRERPDLTRRMDWAFGGYLAVIVTVNGVLAIAVMGGWLAWGRIIAELVLALMSLPASALVGVRRQLAKTETDELVAAETESAKQAQDVAERERVIVLENSQILHIRQMELEAQAAEADKARAERAAIRSARAAKKPTATATAPKSAVIYRSKDEMAAALIPAFFAANLRNPSLAEVGAMLGVKASLASTYRTKYQVVK